VGSRVNLLLDTHASLWWSGSDRRLSPAAAEALSENSNIVYVSAAAAWELSIKTNLGNLRAEAILSDFSGLLFQIGLRRLGISTEHAIRAGQLPLDHKDPSDRMLAAQSQALNFPIISADRVFDQYDFSGFGSNLFRQSSQCRPEDRVEILFTCGRHRPLDCFLCQRTLITQVGKC
jgi:PIN domain nuclease of toxin-antitoxin system